MNFSKLTLFGLLTVAFLIVPLSFSDSGDNNQIKGFSISPVSALAAQAPTAYLQRKINNELWSYNDATISAGDQIQLKWRSTNANNGCTGSGPGFSTNNQTNGTDTSITEPSAGNSSTYTVTCRGDGGSANDSIRVTKLGP